MGACGAEERPATRADAGTDAARPGVALALDAPFAELSVAADNRPDGAPPAATLPVRDWQPDAAGRFTAPLPVRLRTPPEWRLPGDLRLLGPDGAPVARARSSERPEPAWGVEGDRLVLRAPQATGPPEPDAYRVEYAPAAAREARLNHRYSGIEPLDRFVRARAQAGAVSHAGLLLPAPGVAAWDLELPPAARLAFAPGVVRPEALDGPESDGVSFRVEVEAGGRSEEVWSQRVVGDAFEPVRVDLSRWSGQRVRLRFRTEPGGTSVFDYAFFADPVVAPRRDDPRRVMLVFVDTQRADHLGVYGYDRPTSPALDAFARDAVVFDAARSTAPWTLPSARSLLTGRYPEYWDRSETLPDALRARGFATAVFASNVFLSVNFDMQRGWGRHSLHFHAPAGEMVDRALAWLERQEGRDVLLMLQFMDPHLPYQEPAAYRKRFAGAAPDALGEHFLRPWVVNGPELSAGERDYVRGRYDNNVRYVDDELGRLFGRLRESDIVVYFSDHGEEFWDHGGFEHGHSLYDELLRVPLVLRAPGVAPARVEGPVSLLDVAPTVAELLGLPFEGDGVSLLPALRGDEAFGFALLQRKLAFGHPLYGDARWGVLLGSEKYVTSAGGEHLFNLARDPGEHTDLWTRQRRDALPAFRAHLAEALGREVVVAYRLAGDPARSEAEGPRRALLRVPGGFERAWVRDDPRARSRAEMRFEGETLRASWHAGGPDRVEVFAVPRAPIGESGPLELEVEGAGESERIRVEVPPGAGEEPPGEPLAEHRFASGGAVALGFAVVPLPEEGLSEARGFDAEAAEMLRALGYLEEDAP